MTTSELERKLKNAGCKLVEQNKKHSVWYSDKTKNYVRLPRHPSKEVATGTAETILKDMGAK